MLLKIALALVGGTVISLIFGYLVAYWRDIGRDSPKNMDEHTWFRFFEAMTSLKKEAFKFTSKKESRESQRRSSSTSGAPGAQSKRRSRAPSSWQKHPEIQRLLLKFDDFYPELYRYFQNFKDRGDELAALEARELEKILGERVSATMMADRMHELLELKAFDSLGVQDAGAKRIRELWLCYSAAQMYLDDARLGSATVSKKLSQELNLEASSVFRGIEVQCLLSKGASKKALFKKYWQEQQKQSFERSLYLQNLTAFERSQLCYKWVQTKAHVQEVKRQLSQTLQEMEKAFQAFYREYNSGQKQQQTHKKKGQKQEHHRQQKREAPPQQKSSDSLQWAYDLLEMGVTTEFSLIKKQFKKMAMKYHPDRLAREGLGELECRRHHEHFVEVQKAYQTLEKRYGSKAA